jgi:hypothetical protein
MILTLIPHITLPLLLGAIERVTASREGETFALIADVAVDTVKNYLPINVNQDADANWAEQVRSLTTNRFRLIHSLTNGNGTVSPSKAVSAPTQEVAPAAPANASKSAQARPGAGNNDDIVEDANIPEPVVEEDPSVEDAPPVEEIEDTPSGVEIFVPAHDNAEGPRASSETIQALKEFVTEAEIPKDKMRLLSGLLKRTFGVNKAAEVSDANLSEFIDHYVAFGADSFSEVLDTVR